MSENNSQSKPSDKTPRESATTEVPMPSTQPKPYDIVKKENPSKTANS
ncbi:MAG: hypothetical protein QG657_2298 [Acidobacteriota bacterium]|nr:hypothetical protein [Acidobacteriota bacterium]